MWQKQTRDEMKQSNLQKFGREFLFGLGGAAVIACLIAVGIRNVVISRAPSTEPVSLNLPFILILAGLLGLVIAFMRTRKDGTLLCPRCDTAKKPDGCLKCACGGKFVPLSTMKWVEEKSEQNGS